jgi:copper oxidase (laccase) domain-containing protein
MMRCEFDAQPQSMFAYISPCAGGEAYEVGGKVARLFSKTRHISGDKYTLDIRAEIRDELIAAGISPGRIECSDACTIRDHLYHSYRRDSNTSGRMAAIIAMKP